jgi:NitT/TauT family transport system substrate-binding protein
MDYKIKLIFSAIILFSVLLSSNSSQYLSVFLGQDIAKVESKSLRNDTKTDTLNLGYFPEVYHAPAIIGVENGDFNKTLNTVTNFDNISLKPHIFTSGHSVLEALYSGDIDVAYLDPDSIIDGYILLGGNEFRIISGVSSGGDYLVVRNESGIETVHDLGEKKFATLKKGNTQDVALRKYLIDNKFNTIENGGNVTVLNLKSPDILTKFQNKEIDGAWVSEPLVSTLVDQSDGKILVDERDIWPNYKYVSSNIVVRTEYLMHNPDIIKKFLKAHQKETLWINQLLLEINNTTEVKMRNEEVIAYTLNKGLMNITGKTFPENQIIEAMSRIDYTTDPLPNSILKISEDAEELGYITKGLNWNDKFLRIYDLTLLNEILAENGAKQFKPIQ